MRMQRTLGQLQLLPWQSHSIFCALRPRCLSLASYATRHEMHNLIAARCNCWERAEWVSESRTETKWHFVMSYLRAGAGAGERRKNAHRQLDMMHAHRAHSSYSYFSFSQTHAHSGVYKQRSDINTHTQSAAAASLGNSRREAKVVTQDLMEAPVWPPPCHWKRDSWARRFYCVEIIGCGRCRQLHFPIDEQPTVRTDGLPVFLFPSRAPWVQRAREARRRPVRRRGEKTCCWVII